MAIVRWAPRSMWADESFDDMIRRTFGEFGTGLLQRQSWAPPLDAFVRDGTLHVRLELPGIDPDNDIEIEVSNGALSVSGERQQKVSAEGEGFARREMRYGRFERQLALPEGVDADSLSATYDAGILEITVPIPTEEKKKVTVQVGKAKQLKE